ncbi:MAG TPA: hypothetical protein VIO14_13920 [Dehalococcoidia bacterium]
MSVKFERLQAAQRETRFPTAARRQAPACPHCRTAALVRREDVVQCLACSRSFPVHRSAVA